jgi:hypothetical protein
MAKLTPKVKAARKKPGGSNVGKYKGVKEFAGPSGGAPAGSYPINTKSRAKSALKLAHNAPNPSGIKSKVYAEYPSLRKSSTSSTEGRYDGHGRRKK